MSVMLPHYFALRSLTIFCSLLLSLSLTLSWCAIPVCCDKFICDVMKTKILYQYTCLSHTHRHSPTHVFLGTQKCDWLSQWFCNLRTSQTFRTELGVSQVAANSNKFFVFCFLFWFLFLFCRRFVRSYKIKFAWFKLKNTFRCGSIKTCSIRNWPWPCRILVHTRSKLQQKRHQLLCPMHES